MNVNAPYARAQLLKLAVYFQQSRSAYKSGQRIRARLRDKEKYQILRGRMAPVEDYLQ